ETEYVRSANACEIQAYRLSTSGQFVKAGEELEKAAELMKGAYGITLDETHKIKVNRFVAAAREAYNRERNMRPTPEISEILAEYCRKWEGEGSVRYYEGEARQIREHEGKEKEFAALMEIHRAERAIIENHEGQDSQITAQLFGRVLELLPQAARGLELNDVTGLKERLHDLALTVYGQGPEAYRIDKAMEKVTHCRRRTTGQKVRRRREQEDSFEWSRRNYIPTG
ncbi:MAG: hypothetical protein HZB67_01705, partial [Candidatus Aenigmarchaeota archaeon]|nr:hypothetical protein [Candidatus Aenigmarchaeota archaeon]